MSEEKLNRNLIITLGIVEILSVIGISILNFLNSDNSYQPIYGLFVHIFGAIGFCILVTFNTSIIGFLIGGLIGLIIKEMKHSITGGVFGAIIGFLVGYLIGSYSHIYLLSSFSNLLMFIFSFLGATIIPRIFNMVKKRNKSKKAKPDSEMQDDLKILNLKVKFENLKRKERAKMNEMTSDPARCFKSN